MAIKSVEFQGRYYPADIIGNEESGGLMLVQYSTPKEPDAVTLSEDHRYYGCWDKSDHYILTIPRKEQRNVQRSAIVVRSSVNCFRFMYADKQGVEFGIAKTYKELHDALQPLWKRSLS